MHIEETQTEEIERYLPCIVHEDSITQVKERFVLFIQMILPFKMAMNSDTIVPAKRSDQIQSGFTKRNTCEQLTI